MRSFLSTTTLLMIIVSGSSAKANTADTVCTLSGTEINFDLATGTPPDSGSRVFQEIDFFKKKGASEPSLRIPDEKTSDQYRVDYHDDARGNWAISIYKAKSKRRLFHADWKLPHNGKPATGEVESRLPGLRGKGALDCPE